MKFRPALAALPLLGSLCLSAQDAEEFQVRLLTPLASFSKPGTPFQAKIIGSVMRPNDSSLPVGTLVRGFVRQASSPGLGIKRERASLELAFDDCELPSGETLQCNAALLTVDNAREEVKKNRIQGILAASHPHSWLNGLWFRPTLEFVKRSPGGLIGAGGLLQSKVFPTPLGAAITVTLRLLFLRIPDSEITLPSGTQLMLRVSADHQQVSAPLPDPELSEETFAWLSRVPTRIFQLDHSPVADLINLAFIADRESILTAFEAAGWSQADRVNARTFARTYAAVSAMRSYPTAPVSPLLYQGREPDFVFQKSFNSLGKRHHIRLWAVESPSGPVLLGAATHDTDLIFDWKRMSTTHRIDMRIDRERNTLINDLTESACLAAMGVVDRPELEQQTQQTREAVTDGALVVAQLRVCQASPLNGVSVIRPRQSIGAAFVRRMVMEGRQYFTRGNAYYWAYRGIRWSFKSRPSERQDDVVAGARRPIRPAAGMSALIQPASALAIK